MATEFEKAVLMQNEAASRLHAAEYAEAAAWARLASVDTEAPIIGDNHLAILIAEANEAYGARVLAALHYANCRIHAKETFLKLSEESTEAPERTDVSENIGPMAAMGLYRKEEDPEYWDSQKDEE